MRKFHMKPKATSVRAKKRFMAKGTKAKKLTLLGAAAATAVTVGATPAMALSSETYFIGFPGWLPIGDVQTLPSDPAAINNAIVGAKDSNPLIGWGTGGVNLRPAWVVWPDGLPSYTAPEIGQTGSHQETNPLFQPAWDAVYYPAYETYYNLWTWAGGCRGSSNRTQCAVNKATSAANSATADISRTITVPDYGIVEDGYWTTTTAGRWVSPTELEGLPPEVQAAYAAYAAQHGDTGALAPLMNWTTYLTNVNLIAYGDGAIATGQAYQQYIDGVKNGQYTVGQPLTGPRQIRIVGDDGQVRLVNVYVTNNPLDLPDVTFPPEPGQQPDVEVVQPGGVIDATLLSLVLVRNPGRPNGGLYSRFSPEYVTPERQDVLPEGVDPELVAKLINGDFSDVDDAAELLDLIDRIEAADGKPIVITAKVDATWEYDLMSDAPATLNPFSWANSIASSIFLTNLITGIDPANPGTAPAGTLVKAYVVPAGQPDAGTVYVTYAPRQLPLLAPLRLPTQLLSILTGQTINNPIADAIEPALKMLVDLGYTDVVRNPDGTYSRTLDQMHIPTPLGSKAPLGPEQLLSVPGDLITLLGQGIGQESNQELEQVVSLIQELAAPSTPLDPGVKQILQAGGDAITVLSKGAGDVSSAALTEIGEPVIAADPEAADTVSTVVQGALPPAQEPVQAMAAAGPAEGSAPAEVSAAAESPASAQMTADRKRPLLNVVTGTGNPAREPRSGASAATAGSNLRQQVREAVTNVNTGVKNAVDGFKSALSGGAKSPGSGSVSGGSSADGGNSGSGDSGSGSDGSSS